MEFYWYFICVLKVHIIISEYALETPWQYVIRMAYFYILATFQS